MISTIRPQCPAVIEAADVQRIYNGDLNELTTVGLYEVYGTITHGPTQTDVATAYVVNFRQMQMLLAYYDDRVFIGSENNGTWGDWKEVVSQSLYYYKANDTYSTTGSTAASRRPVLSGFSASDSKTLYFNVPVDKSLANITNISITALTGSMFGISGAVGTTSTDWTGDTYSLDAHKTSEHTVRIAISKANNTAFDIDGGTPIGFSAYVTLKFDPTT